MNKAKKIIFTFLTLALLVLSVSSCGKNNGDSWLSNYETAKETAAKKEKNILLLFSGDDWDGISASLKDSVFYSKDFVSKAQKNYVLLNIDFSQTEYAMTEITADSTDEEIAEATRIEAEYVVREQIAERYNLADYPSLYVISPDEYGLAYIELDFENEDPASLLQKLADTEETQKQIVTLVSAIDAAEGLDRVRAIDALYNATDPILLNPLADFAPEVVSLDPTNQTGLIGKYEYEVANQKAMDHAMYEGDVEAASKEFEDVCVNGHLNAAEKQNAYYMAAYIRAMSLEPDFDKMISLMESAYDADPSSELAPQILQIIENIKTVQSEQE